MSRVSKNSPWSTVVVCVCAVVAAVVLVTILPTSPPHEPAAGATAFASGATVDAAPFQPPAVTAPSTTVPSPTPPPSIVADPDPFAGGIFGEHPEAGEQADAWRAERPADAAAMERIAKTPAAVWFGDWTTQVTRDVAQVVKAAGRATPVLVAYNIPGRDCGGYSSGGAASEAAYAAWIEAFAAGIGDRRAAVILEPDALAHACGDTTALYRMLDHAVAVLAANPDTYVYIDAGDADWLDAGTTAERLRRAGVGRARGFAVNVSNFVPTDESVAYGERISDLLGGGPHYVVDTSRNGNGTNGEWCNPPGRALGVAPTTRTGKARADAFLWIKTPGESDGDCDGNPPAGTWMPEYALDLAEAG